MRFLRVAGMVLMIVWMITGGLRALGALFAGDFVWAVLGIAQIGVALLLYDRLRTWTPREANPDLE
jgi:hypothetical protein